MLLAANRYKPLQLPSAGYFGFVRGWRVTLIVAALLALVLLPILGSFIGAIQSSTFPYPGLQMDFKALAVDRIDSKPTYRNLTIAANFQDLYNYGGSTLLRVSIVVQDSVTSVVQKYIDISTRLEYVSITASGGSVTVPASVYTVLWLPRQVRVGDMVGVNSFAGTVEGPVTHDSFGNPLPTTQALLVRTAEGSFYYTLDTKVLELYQSNVALTAIGFPSPTPLRSITIVSYNDVAARGIMQGFLASLFVLLAAVGVFGIHYNIDRRRERRIEGLRNRIKSLSEIMEDQYLLGLMSREAYMRKQVVLRRLAADLDGEFSQSRRHNEESVAGNEDDFFPAP